MERRRFLEVATFSTGLIAGCGTNRSRQSPSSKTRQNPTTAVFTGQSQADTTTDSVSKSTISPKQGPTTAGVKATASAPELVFDGGDLEAFRSALQTLNEYGGGILQINPAEYNFEPLQDVGVHGRSPHAYLRHLEDITIEGNGAIVNFNIPTLAGFRFWGGKNIEIRNLEFDYDPPPFTQGVVTDLSSDKYGIELELEGDLPSLEHEMFDAADEVYALTFTPDGEFVKGYPRQAGWDLYVESISGLGDNLFQLQVSDSSTVIGLREGMRLVVLARNNRTTVQFTGVSNPKLSDVTIRAANGAAFSAQVCESPDFRNVIIEPDTDSERLISANADGIRIINCERSSTVDGCRHEYLGDDSLVIQHTLTEVVSIIDKRTIQVEEVHPVVAAEGDRFSCMSASGLDKGLLPPVDEVSGASWVRDRIKPGILRFESSVKDRVSVGDFIGNRRTASQNFVVRNNEFRNHRANLIRIAASDGEISDNVVEGCPIDPIELETDTFGYFAPKGWVRNVDVRNNKILRAGLNYYSAHNPAGIHVHHRTAPDVAPEGRPNRNIRLVNNTIDGSAFSGIAVEGAENVEINANNLSGLNQLDLPNFGDLAILVRNVVGGSITENVAESSENELDYFGTIRESADVTQSGNKLKVDGKTEPAELVQLSPISFVFNKTVRPSDVNPDSGDNRPLALSCRLLELNDTSGNSILRIDVGSVEDGADFGDGIYSPGSNDEFEWRWFGGPEGSAEVFFANRDLDPATELRFIGLPMTSGISAEIKVDGKVTDKVAFGSREWQEYRASLV